MGEIKLGLVESRFADIIWMSEPVASGELVARAKEELNWNKSTTYTVLRRLCERGIFVNEGGMVRSLYEQKQPATLSIGKYTDEGDLILEYLLYDGENILFVRDSRR